MFGIRGFPKFRYTSFGAFHETRDRYGALIRAEKGNKMAFVINGPNGGNGFIFGNTAGDEILNGFDFNNVFISGGANEQINTGAGNATVNLGAFVGLTDTVNLGGAFNMVATSGAGHLNSTLTVQGGTGRNAVNLMNVSTAANLGSNQVTLQGFDNNITVNSNATNIILSGAGRGKVTAGVAGDGDYGFTTSVTAAGTNNNVKGGDQNFVITGGQGFDVISVGNGNNLITEAGPKDSITITNTAGIGSSNLINDFGGGATIMFQAVGNSPYVLFPPGATEQINLAGTNNTVIEKVTSPLSDRDFTINISGTEASAASANISLGNGIDVITAPGANSTITAGTPDHGAPGQGDSVTANGANDKITLGNGNNKVVANGANDTIKLGNGANTLTANGNGDTDTLGNGNNMVTAGGNGDTITLGTGNNTVLATGNNDIITSAGGTGHFTLGTKLVPGQNTLTLNASGVGTTVDSEGTLNNIVLQNNANAAITDSPFGGGLSLKINAQGGANAGKISITGFGSDTGVFGGVIDLHGFAGITNTGQLFAASSSDGAGGTLIKLGTGSLDLVSSTIDTTQFSFA